MATTTKKSTRTSSKFDLRAEATRGLYAGAGVADLAVATVRDYAATVQKRFEDVSKDVAGRVDEAQKTVSGLTPKTVRQQAIARVNELQAEARAVPTRVQTRIDDTTTSASQAYAELVERGEDAVKRLRGDADVQTAVADAKETVAKAKTTRTQATKAARSTSASAKSAARSTARAAKTGAETTARTAKKTATTTRKTAAKKTAPAKSSAKATATAAKKTAAAGAKAAEKAVETAGTGA